jgi:hypothetical protein
MLILQLVDLVVGVEHVGVGGALGVLLGVDDLIDQGQDGEEDGSVRGDAEELGQFVAARFLVHGTNRGHGDDAYEDDGNEHQKDGPVNAAHGSPDLPRDGNQCRSTLAAVMTHDHDRLIRHANPGRPGQRTLGLDPCGMVLGLR